MALFNITNDLIASDHGQLCMLVLMELGDDVDTVEHIFLDWFKS